MTAKSTRYVFDKIREIVHPLEVNYRMKENGAEIQIIGCEVLELNTKKKIFMVSSDYEGDMSKGIHADPRASVGTPIPKPEWWDEAYQRSVEYERKFHRLVCDIINKSGYEFYEWF